MAKVHINCSRKEIFREKLQNSKCHTFFFVRFHLIFYFFMNISSDFLEIILALCCLYVTEIMRCVSLTYEVRRTISFISSYLRGTNLQQNEIPHICMCVCVCVCVCVRVVCVCVCGYSLHTGNYRGIILQVMIYENEWC